MQQQYIQKLHHNGRNSIGDFNILFVRGWVTANDQAKIFPSLFSKIFCSTISDDIVGDCESVKIRLTDSNNTVIINDVTWEPWRADKADDGEIP